MKNSPCPFLGLKNDPKTCLIYADPRNICHHVQKKAPPKLSYQSEICLSTGWQENCVLYKDKSPEVLPPHIISSRYERMRRRKNLRLILAVSGILLGVLILILVLQFLFNQQKQQYQSFEQQTREFLGIEPINPSDEIPIIRTFTPQSIAESACEIDPDWISYTVKPTDSIFRISLLYNISVETILAANCLGDETYITPHQVIYIPISPSPTPTNTATVTATKRIIVLPTATENPPKAATRPPPTATSIPPTATNPPPTATQVPPSPTTIPPTETEISTPTLPVLPTQPNP